MSAAAGRVPARSTLAAEARHLREVEDLAALLATLEPGAPFILDALDFDDRMRASRAVVTGEGKLDEQTLQGKLVGEIGTRTRQAGMCS